MPKSKKTNRLRVEGALAVISLQILGLAIFNLVVGGRHADSIVHQQRDTTYDPPPAERSARVAKSEAKPRLQLSAGKRNNYDPKIYDGGQITQILRGKKDFPKGESRLRYRPGTLKMSHAEALQHCFVNTTHYKGHMSERAQSLMSVSDIHKIIYRNNPKASSSSARHAMQDFLEGGDVRMKHDAMEDKVHEKGYEMISFIREPLSRFYSSYDEAFFRMGPWMESGPIVRDKPRVRQQYLNSKWKVEKYPYLYEGMDNIQDFRKMYCPRKILREGHFLDCNAIPSIDDGNLAHRFEQFVRDYSGLDPFDIHLNLQISNLVFPTGEPFPLTILYNSTEAEKGWQEVAKKRGVTIPDGEMTHGRKITRRFNVTKVSNTSKRKICRILALDYCCLNIELPEVCREDVDGEEGVYCSMEKRDEKTMKYALETLVIQTWKDP